MENKAIFPKRAPLRDLYLFNDVRTGLIGMKGDSHSDNFGEMIFVQNFSQTIKLIAVN